MSVDRLSAGYQPEFDIDASVGRQGELFVLSIAEALAHDRGETKYEPAASKYGNVYIEFACRRHGEYVPSGIETTGADYWAFVIGRDRPAIAVVAHPSLVRAVKERAIREGQIRNTIRGSHPTNGAVVSLSKLLVWLLDEADRTELAA